ncbi:MAG: tyrosine--tRNA ligase [Patescibacteria group bacterium]
MNSSDQQIAEFLTRSVENVYPKREALEMMLESGKTIRVYLGVDPTGPTLHIGHAIAMRKLAELQRMGHEVILLIGDFTAMIGDPTDKTATRKRLTREEVLDNCKTYQEQASKILNFSGSNPAKLMFNSEWLRKMTLEDALELASHYTVQQMMERDMFAKRWEAKKEIHLPEFLYPLMQGYDSVAMDVDLEIGGNDQTFNMLVGRTLMREIKGKEKMVMTIKLLADATGKKMGKTEGNMISLADSGEEMYGKVMSWTDGMILSGFELCTDVPVNEIVEIGKKMEAGENPVEFKHRLAYEIVAGFIDDASADHAAEQFMSVHKAGEVPDDVSELSVGAGMTLADVLVGSELVPSKAEVRRQISQGEVKVDGVVAEDQMMMVKAGSIIQKGKRFFVRAV